MKVKFQNVLSTLFSHMPNHCSYIKATSHKPQATATSHSHSYSYSHSHSHKPQATCHKPQATATATSHMPCSYIKDTSDFTNRINETKDINEDKIVVTLDVKLLYTNIPNHEGIEAVKILLNFISQKLIATKVIIKLLFLILTLNNFVFNGIHYQQKFVCAMGTICAPNCANIFMRKFEKTCIYPNINLFSNFYC